MISAQIYVLISILILLVIATLIFFFKKNKKQRKLTPLSGISFLLVIFGIILGDNRILSYSLMGAGVLLAIIDIIKRSRKK